MRQDFQSFLALEVSGSVVLLAATVLALLLANSPWADAFEHFWEIEAGFHVGDLALSQHLLHWIDDALMALFFFIVGLEIKREVIVGELSRLRQAALPVVAALGGMLVPALLYSAVNAGGPGAHGWGVPMATDIAFALGVLALLGDRIPAGLKVFLTALAIADDIGAVLVIAFFYSSGVAVSWLGLAAALLVVLVGLNALGIESPVPYFAIGSVIWFAFLNSGVHATLAGVLVAFTIPSKAKMQPVEFVEWARRKLDEIVEIDVPGAHVLETDDQQLCAMEIQSRARFVQAPLQRLLHGLHPFTTFLILPLFALANAGVSLAGEGSGSVLGPVSVGVVVGLVVGKQAGIALFSWLVVRLGWAGLPSGVTWRHIWGAGLLAGIGFTMSLFVSGLAFESAELVAQAKVGILLASVISGFAGYLVLRGTARGNPAA
ncbi:MAG: sodium/proton antiporter NhaA [Coriobacteriia bacterium]